MEFSSTNDGTARICGIDHLETSTLPAQEQQLASMWPICSRRSAPTAIPCANGVRTVTLCNDEAVRSGRPQIVEHYPEFGANDGTAYRISQSLILAYFSDAGRRRLNRDLCVEMSAGYEHGRSAAQTIV